MLQVREGEEKGGGHKTDVKRDWEWKGRKRGNMIENEASAGLESWMSFCSSGTATGLNLRNSAKHLSREAEFLFLGGLRLPRNHFWNIYMFLKKEMGIFFSFGHAVTSVSLGGGRSGAVEAGFCGCLRVCVGCAWVCAWVCVCLRVATCKIMFFQPISLIEVVYLAQRLSHLSLDGNVLTCTTR